ncbi:MAG: sigma-54-dependent Fis family transcriptional regulator, partial [Gemmatimonadota bacterium]|nr:sigma-54-dependent Fis family transcriptional regulator [Gemmatimonadota bacterium]
ILGKLREELARPELRFSEEALALLLRYPFPGNVRQLQNIIERAATLADGDTMGPESLPPTVSGLQETLAVENGELSLPQGFSLERFLDDAERRYLLAALDRTGGVKVRAAETLGLSFRSFRYRLAKHGLGDREES